MCGISTSRNICHSLAPRSFAASSCSRLKLASRDRTTIVTKGKQKVMCAMVIAPRLNGRSEEHTSELQSLMRISYAVFCLKKKTTNKKQQKNDSDDQYCNTTNN